MMVCARVQQQHQEAEASHETPRTPPPPAIEHQEAQLPPAQPPPTPLAQTPPQPPPTPPLEPPPEVDGAEHDAKQNALSVLLVVTHSMLAHEALVSYEKREEKKGDGEDEDWNQVSGGSGDRT